MSQLIVADAGPLIGMAQVGLLSLLPSLYSEILIPPGVHGELEISTQRPGYELLAAALDESWLRVEAPIPTTDLEELRQVLGKGEAEAIALAKERNTALLIDERQGRSFAESRGIEIVGTGAILLLAKERRLIASVKEILDQLAAHKYRLGPSLRARILERAGEA